MTDVSTTISSANLNILGGPSTVQVSVDYGQRGDRGSIILYGQGKPTLVTLQETPLVYDMYVNLLPSDNEYQWIYQYISTPTGLAWKPLFKLQPNTYSDNQAAVFVDGSVELWVPVTSITGGDDSLFGVDSSNFNIQHSVISVNPVASSITIGDLELSPLEVLSLPITINATEFLDDSWSPVSGEKLIHLFITVI
jgi:hypothetical protein